MRQKERERHKLACSRGILANTILYLKKSAKYIRGNLRVSQTDGGKTDPEAR